jgi:(R,R)-butanediol dehydrogenase / meso-butanediol dehydrogenase / diacetyl reductase
MKAAVLKGRMDIRIEEREAPLLHSKQVLVKVKAVGICGSDIHAFTHLTFPPGTIMGHEFAGEIAGISPGITKWKVGDRVAIRPCGVCGDCFWCKNGQISLCPTHMETTLGLKTPGAYAEYVSVPEYQLYSLPEDITYEQAAQLEPVTVCLHMLDMAELRIGENVLIYGAGPLGLLTFQLARMAGANEIYVVEKTKFRREKALELGAEYVFSPEEFTGSKVIESLPRKGVDIVFECAGVQSTIQGSFEMVRKGGRVILLGISPEPIQLDHFKWIVKGVEVRASIGYFESDFGRALSLVANQKINVDALVSDVISLKDIVAKGFNRLLSPEGVLKILVNPER